MSGALKQLSVDAEILEEQVGVLEGLIEDDDESTLHGIVHFLYTIQEEIGDGNIIILVREQEYGG